MTIKTIKFEDLNPIPIGNKPDLIISDDIVFPDLLGGMTIEEMDDYINQFTGPDFMIGDQIYDLKLIPTSNQMQRLDALLNTNRPVKPLPEIWNQKQEYSPYHFKRAKAVHKRQLNKANRKRARHGK